MKNSYKLLAVMAILRFATSHVMAQGNATINQEDKDKVVALSEKVITPSDTIWRFKGLLGLNATQSYFSNWAAGGQNTIAFTLLGAFGADYVKDRHRWTTILDLAYGQLTQGKTSPIKTDDRIDLTSKYGYQLKNPNWYATLLFNFRTQFAPGYVIENNVEIGEKVSDFFSPAYSILSLGFDYRPNEHFSLLLSPVTNKITIVSDERLATNYGLDAGENVRMEFGAFVKASYHKEVFKNVDLLTRIDLFANYADNPQNIDVNWETLVTLKVNDWLNVTITTQLLYDDDVLIGGVDPVIVDGVEITPGVIGAPRTQFKEVLALGLSWRVL